MRLLAYNEDFRLHPLIVGNEREWLTHACSSLVIFYMVGCHILFLPPPFQCTTLSIALNLVLLPVGIA